MVELKVVNIQLSCGWKDAKQAKQNYFTELPRISKLTVVNSNYKLKEGKQRKRKAINPPQNVLTMTCIVVCCYIPEQLSPFWSLYIPSGHAGREKLKGHKFFKHCSKLRMTWRTEIWWHSLEGRPENSRPWSFHQALCQNVFVIMWSIYEIAHIWTAVVDES